MKVSIIMCAYNVASFIEEAIESIQRQTYKNWELIISNDASLDATVQIAERYLGDQRIKLYNQPNNLGYVSNKNWAFAEATGDLVTQLDADDTCAPQRLEKQVAAFRTYPALKICGTNFQYTNLEGEPFASKKYEKDLWISFGPEPYPFWFPNLMVRKEVIQEFGLFSEYFSGIYGDDQYWTLRVNTKYPVYFIKDILYSYRTNPDSLTNVLDNPRKLIVEEILSELKNQRLKTGTDWLEQGREDQAKQFEQQLFTDKNLMAEKYRIWAAKAIDKKRPSEARHLLKKSWRLKPFSLDLLRTIVYYMRSTMKQKPGF